MPDSPNALAEFVQAKISEKGLNYRETARRSRGLISYTTVSDVVNGRNLNPSLRTLRGLAYGLGVSEQEIVSISKGKSLDFDELVALLPYEYEELSEEQKKEIRPTLEMVINDIRRRKRENGLPRKKT